LLALEHHTYSEGDVEEGGIKIKRKTIFFSHENGYFLGWRSEKKPLTFYFYSKSPLLDVGGFAKQGTCIQKYSP
jgi:hypothetical protein